MKRNMLAPLIAICVILLGLSVGSFFFTPDRTFSENENRYLQTTPELTADSVLSGRFMTEVENYTSDQILLRDLWTGARSTLQRAEGRQDISGTYLGAEGRYFAKVTDDTFNWSNYEKNLTAVEQFFAANSGKRCTALIAPSPAGVLGEYLPKNAPYYDEDKAFSLLTDKLGGTFAAGGGGGSLLPHRPPLDDGGRAECLPCLGGGHRTRRPGLCVGAGHRQLPGDAVLQGAAAGQRI